MAAKIYFDGDQKLDVTQSSREIREAVIGLGSVLTPMVALTKVGTEESVMVFASQIRYVVDTQGAPEPMVASV